MQTVYDVIISVSDVIVHVMKHYSRAGKKFIAQKSSCASSQRCFSFVIPSNQLKHATFPYTYDGNVLTQMKHYVIVRHEYRPRGPR
jgi:hypothetical protein